ncbi:FkbM family methyltransferase [Oleisolibacter albus]|uniref:FkbM family methyltransferase n=1 Tax=Oleisolibacter albus TaxID=2171757 RepID=UPI000DF2F2D3|nr:FkbM family methyltransferase [Oleisolibacter albus]
MQFINSLQRIQQARHLNRLAALGRHLLWQARKPLLRFAPADRRLSRSLIRDDVPGGVIALVNSLGCYDYNNMSFVQHLLRQGGLFIDVGANIGAYTLIASELPGVTVVALEPNPTAFRKLCFNVERNRRRNVHLLNEAASDHAGTIQMTNDGSSSINRVVDPVADPDGQQAATIAVPCRRLDQSLPSLGLPIPDGLPVLVKMDIEGHEPAALAGMEGLFDRIDAILVENGERDGCRRILTEAGFQGPYFVDLGSARLRRAPLPGKEDALYLRAPVEGFCPD